MNKVNKIIMVPGLCLTGLLLACGGNSSNDSGSDEADFPTPVYTGNVAAALVGSENARALGQAAGESVSWMLTASLLPRSGLDLNIGAQAPPVDLQPFDLQPLLNALNQPDRLAVAKLQALSAALLDISKNFCDAGGRALYDGDILPGAPARGRITLEQCGFSTLVGVLTMNGPVDVRITRFGSSTTSAEFNFAGLEVRSASGASRTLNFYLQCSNLADASGCNTVSLFAGSDGREHRITGQSPGGDGSRGYAGRAELDHHSHGRVSMTFSFVRYGLCGTTPESGIIELAGAQNSSASIRFDHSPCELTGSWSDGVTAGSF